MKDYKKNIKGKAYQKLGFWYVLSDGLIYTLPVNCWYGDRIYYNWGAVGADEVHPSWLEGFEGAKEREFFLD